jgi:glycosyltransferase involved in cell wall biosynthesis
MTCATTVVANTAAGVRAWGVGPAKARVVYNGFDWSRIDAEPAPAGSESTPGGGPEHPFVVVMTSRMAPAKDFRTVIAAARLLQQESPAYRFVLVGDGPQRDELVPAAGLEVIGYVRQAHVGVLMTNPDVHQEGCSNAIMEYMACGLPVVCGEGGGNRELVEHGKTGFVIAPSDPRKLAERIAYLREHHAERQAMGEAGRQRIAEVFSLERMVEGYVRIYEEALSRRRR